MCFQLLFLNTMSHQPTRFSPQSSFSSQPGQAAATTGRSPSYISQPSPTSATHPSTGHPTPVRGGSIARAVWEPYNPHAGLYPAELENAVRHEVRVQLQALEEEFARRIVDLKKKHWQEHSAEGANEPELREQHTKEIKEVVEEYKRRVHALEGAEHDVCGEFEGTEEGLTV